MNSRSLSPSDRTGTTSRLVELESHPGSVCLDEADSGQQGLETPPHKPGLLTELKEGLARAWEAGGPRFCPRRQRPTELVGRAVGAPRRTPSGGERRASVAGNEEAEAATNVDRRQDATRPVLRAAEGRRWRLAMDNLQDRVRIADAPPGESWPGEGGGDTGDTAPRDLEAGPTS